MPHAIKVDGARIVACDRSKPQPLPANWTYVPADEFEVAVSGTRPIWEDGHVHEMTPAELEAEQAALDAVAEAAAAPRRAKIADIKQVLTAAGVATGNPLSTTVDQVAATAAGVKGAARLLALQAELQGLGGRWSDMAK